MRKSFVRYNVIQCVVLTKQMYATILLGIRKESISIKKCGLLFEMSIKEGKKLNAFIGDSGSGKNAIVLLCYLLKLETNMSERIYEVIYGLLLFAVGYLVTKQDNPSGQTFFNQGILVIASVMVVKVLLPTLANIKRIGFVLKKIFLSLRHEKIRCSMSYQYLIELGGKYLLIKNRTTRKYQFVGGKYKYYPSATCFLTHIECEPDNKLAHDLQRENDLALFVPAKNIDKFIKWFKKGKNREINPFREFYEELVSEAKSGESLLSKDLFAVTNFSYGYTVQTPIKRSPPGIGWDCWEFLNYDVFIPEFTAEQKEALAQLQASEVKDGYYHWFSKSEIMHLGRDEANGTETCIGEHTKWILNKKWTRR